MRSNLPIVAAIPNYNMASELSTLLSQLVGQGYDGIYVLDDASSDHSREVVDGLSGAVTFVQGRENRGAGGNRNRIIGALARPSLIHFIDADSILETPDTASVARAIVPSNDFGVVGCMSKTIHGHQRVWNYGPKQSLYADIGSIILAHIERIMDDQPEYARNLHDQYSYLLKGWPDPFSAPIRTGVFWNSEHSFIVRSDIFAALGGFDVRLREREMQDLAIRMASKGLRRIFDPNIAVRHTMGDVRPHTRRLQKILSELRVMRHQGYLSWLFSIEIE